MKILAPLYAAVAIALLCVATAVPRSACRPDRQRTASAALGPLQGNLDPRPHRPWPLTVAQSTSAPGASRCAGNWCQKWLLANHF